MDPTSQWHRAIAQQQASRTQDEAAAAQRLLKVLEETRKDLVAKLTAGGLSNAARRRASQLVAQVSSAMRELSDKGGTVLSAAVSDAKRNGQAMTVRAIDPFDPRLAGDLGSFDLLPLRTMALLDQTVLDRWEGLTDSARVFVSTELQKGLALGESYDKLIQRLLGEHGSGSIYTSTYAPANRLVRNAVNEAYSVAAHETIVEAQKRNPKMQRVWVSRLVNSTPICATLHGQVVDVDKPFTYGGWQGMTPPAIGSGAQPTFHICHSTVAAYQDDWDLDIKPLTPAEYAEATQKRPGTGGERSPDQAKPTPFAESAKQRIGKGIASEDDAIELGKMIRQEAEARLQAQGAFFDNYLDARVAETVRQVVSEVRPLGGVTQDWASGTKSAVKQAVATASASLPRDWLQASRDYGRMKGSVVERGFYRPAVKGGEAAIKLSTGRGIVSVALHEMGHRFENVVPGIVALEQRLYKRRTAGESLRWLGPGYKLKERSRFDKWAEPYMGKDYGGNFFELLSMGLEGIFAGSTDLSGDPEFVHFVLGVVAGV